MAAGAAERDAIAGYRKSFEKTGTLGPAGLLGSPFPALYLAPKVRGIARDVSFPGRAVARTYAGQQEAVREISRDFGFLIVTLLVLLGAITLVLWALGHLPLALTLLKGFGLF